MLTLILVLSAPIQSVELTARLAVRPQTVKAHVRACGFRRVRMVDDAELQEQVVVVRDTTAARAQLTCAARASLAAVTYVQFAAPLDRKYRRIYRAIEDKRLRADAIAWLKTRGLLDKLPKYDSKRAADPATARAIGTACGPKASAILQPRGPIHNIASLGESDEEALYCVMNAATATGYSFGVIGNEAYAR